MEPSWQELASSQDYERDAPGAAYRPSVDEMARRIKDATDDVKLHAELARLRTEVAALRDKLEQYELAAKYPGDGERHRGVSVAMQLVHAQHKREEAEAQVAALREALDVPYPVAPPEVVLDGEHCIHGFYAGCTAYRNHILEILRLRATAPETAPEPAEDVCEWVVPIAGISYGTCGDETATGIDDAEPCPNCGRRVQVKGGGV